MIYGFTAVHGFIAVSCNLMVTFGEAHWVKVGTDTASALGRCNSQPTPEVK